MSQTATVESTSKALHAGVHGYFRKTGDLTELVQALKSIQSKGFYFESSLAGLLHKAILLKEDRTKSQDPLALLTDKEIKIIRMAATGHSNIEIADKLALNIRTVECYRNKIIDKTGSKNFTNAILLAIKYNYISTQEMLTSK